MPPPLYHYRAQVAADRGVIDGDTLSVTVDPGFHMTKRIRLRLTAVDTAEVPPELHLPNITTAELSADRHRQYADGIEQMRFARAWVAAAREEADTDWPFHVHTTNSTGSFNRWLGRIRRIDTGESLSDALYEAFGESVLADYHDRV